MIRWLRIAAVGVAVLTLLVVGVGVGLFLVANPAWVPIETHPWLAWLLGPGDWEVRMPALLAGWLVAVLLGGALLAWSMYYVWRRRQYESLIARVERELVALRTLPFKDPAPLEDLPLRERPDPAKAQALARLARSYEPPRSPAAGAPDELAPAPPEPRRELAAAHGRQPGQPGREA